MMQVNQRKRMQNQIEQAKEAECQLKEDGILVLEPKKDSYNVATMNWRLEFKGRNGTPFEFGIYEVQIRIPDNYPGVAPECYFLDKFEHVHVYQDGKVCMPTLDSKSWDPRISIVELARVLINMIHSDPKPENQANDEMAKLLIEYNKLKDSKPADWQTVRKDTDYEKKLREQANRLRKAHKHEENDKP